MGELYSTSLCPSRRLRSASLCHALVQAPRRLPSKRTSSLAAVGELGLSRNKRDGLLVRGTPGIPSKRGCTAKALPCRLISAPTSRGCAVGQPGQRTGRARWWERTAAGTALTPMCCSTDQVKGVLTLQGDALSQAVSPPVPLPFPCC